MRRRLTSLTAALTLLLAAILLPTTPASAAGGDVHGGDPYRTNTGYRCQVGFTVVGQVTPFTGFITAGHCGRNGDAVYTLGGELMGYFVASSFPGNDFALVQLIPGWTPKGDVRTGPNSFTPVRGSAPAYIGQNVCRYGGTTGWRCGVITAINQTIYYPQGVTYGLTRTNICSEPGDGSAPFIAGDQAQGIGSGTAGNCTSGGTTWFQPVNEVLSTYGLQLVTS